MRDGACQDPRPALFRRLPQCGAIAQLVERLNGIQEVSGSTPLGSTTGHLSEPAPALFWFPVQGGAGIGARRV